MKRTYAWMALALMTGACTPDGKKPLLPSEDTCCGMNPIAPAGLYIADPEVRQMPDGRIYVYGSRDEPQNAWCSHSYNVLSTSDLLHWNVEQFSFATRGTGKQTDYTEKVLYAPDCIHHNGKYYLYYCLADGGEAGADEGVAVADSPYGPFKDGQPIAGIQGIDPSVFIDDDGQAYLFWGQGYAKGAKLSRDLRSIEGAVHDSLLTYETHAFNEASSVRKRNGIYYYVYGGHQRHGESNCATLNYATATSPLGPYTYRGVIIDNWESHRSIVNNHGCIVELNGQWYVAYHRPTHGCPSMRKACLEPITFNEDGSIDEVEMTTQGVRGPIAPTVRMEAARACRLDGHATIRARHPVFDIPVEYLSDIRDGDAAWWKYYDFDKATAVRFRCKTWDSHQAAKIEIRIDAPDGELIGTCEVPAGTDGTAYALHSAPVRRVTGTHALVLVFRAADAADKESDLMNLEWLTFETE